MSMPPPAVPAPEQFTHTGHRFILGYGPDYYGIWDRSSPGAPVRRHPKTPEGWAEAWREYSAWEPQNVPVGGPGSASSVTGTTNGRATAAMVCGIIGLLFGPVAIVALVLGLSARSQIDRSGGQQAGRGNAIAGIVMGSIGIVLWAIWIVYVASRVSELT